MKAGFLEKLIEKVDRIEPGEVQGYLVRLVQEKGFLEKVFEALQEGVVVTDAVGIVSYVNGATTDLLGLNPENVIGEPLKDVIPGLEWDDIVRENKVVSRDLEVFYPENRYLNFYLAPISDETHGMELGRVMMKKMVTIIPRAKLSRATIDNAKASLGLMARV